MLENKFKILIMTASVGNGHDEAAKAIRNYILDQEGNMDIEIIDFINIFPTSIGNLVKNTYLKMIDVVPSWYNLLYEKTMRLNTSSKVTSIFAHKYIKKVQTLIEEANPDMILFTNPFPSTIVSHLKRKNKINVDTATIITDYTAHNVWLDPTIDHYFIGSSILRQEIIERGIDPSRIHVTGIPIHSKFNIPVNREAKMKELGLDPNLPTLLIMGGGLGLGPMEEILETTDQMNRPLQVLVVAGKNQALEESLRKRTYRPLHKVKVLGFCTNIHELMECAHLLISKAGGLTMTEAINKRLPVLIFDPIPGQEVKNAQYFSAIGAALYLKELGQIKDAIEDLLYINPKKREKMVRCCAVFSKPNATEEISKIICDQIRHKAYKGTPMVN